LGQFNNDLSQLFTFDPGHRGSSLFYRFVKEQFGDPIEQALSAISSSPKGRVRIITGFPILPNVIENDGPLGSIVLASALTNSDLIASIFTSSDSCKQLLSISEEVGLPVNVKPINDILGNNGGWDLTIFAEYPGSNRKGIRHNMKGEDISAFTLPLDHLLNGSKTICIGDGGNEVGMGKIEELVRARVRYGNICRCPCTSGIAAYGSSDILIPFGTSNWACYALAFFLGFRFEERFGKDLLGAACRHGLVDGIKKTPSLSVDGISQDTEIIFLKKLNRFTRQ
jgi:hypothetical protein